MNGVAAGGLAVMLAAGLQACCFRSCNGDEKEGMAPASAAIPAKALVIADWGPRGTRAGVPFNVQGGGHAALWVQLDQPLDGRIVLVQFGDAFLEGEVSGRLVSAMVPEAAYADPGVHEVRVFARSGNARWTSDQVLFTVE